MDRDYQLFAEKVKNRLGIDLSQYKEAQMKRRLTTLREKRGFHDFQSYYDALIRDPGLLAEFLDRMTINVSEFFRNPSRWEALKNEILPRLLAENPRPRCWSAGCSTGEEPYTLAIILSQVLPLSRIDILATDIDENALARAKAGAYPERSVKEVPGPLLQRCFTREGELYYIKEEIKRTVRFQKQNLLSDPFNGPFDLIVCRNVIIYFTDEAKEMLYRKFSSALRPGGILFVGSTEQIFHPQKYRFACEAPFFYRKME